MKNTNFSGIFYFFYIFLTILIFELLKFFCKFTQETVFYDCFVSFYMKIIIEAILTWAIFKFCNYCYDKFHNRVKNFLVSYRDTKWYQEMIIRELDYTKWKKEFIEGYNKDEELPYIRKGIWVLLSMPKHCYRPLNKLFAFSNRTTMYENGKNILCKIYQDCINDLKYKPTFINDLKIAFHIYKKK